jgi:hypothetical protein
MVGKTNLQQARLKSTRRPKIVIEQCSDKLAIVFSVAMEREYESISCLCSTDRNDRKGLADLVFLHFIRSSTSDF